MIGFVCLVQVWTNEIYESVEHRVTGNNVTERHSALFSLNPSHYVTMKPLEELTSDENPSKYREFNYGKFTAFRKLSNYKKLNAENIQVEQFRIQEHRGIKWALINCVVFLYVSICLNKLALSVLCLCIVFCFSFFLF